MITRLGTLIVTPQWIEGVSSFGRKYELLSIMLAQRNRLSCKQLVIFPSECEISGDEGKIIC